VYFTANEGWKVSAAACSFGTSEVSAMSRSEASKAQMRQHYGPDVLKYIKFCGRYGFLENEEKWNEGNLTKSLAENLVPVRVEPFHFHLNDRFGDRLMRGSLHNWLVEKRSAHQLEITC
jgi:hypothetical protein